MGSHNLSVCGSTVCVQSVGCTMPIRLGEGGGCPVRGHVLKQQGFRARGGDGRKGEGVGESGG